MILGELVLENFGIYGGRNVIDLEPLSKSQPIVLVGALNGRGKTTLFDSINFALFGQRARLSNRKNLSWNDYLRRAVNKNSAGQASVSLRFSVGDQLAQKVYDVKRSWSVMDGEARESLSISVNGEFDAVLSEDWNSHIEALLPLDVASLHFFDGEKIDELADPAQSSNVIRAAINGLLGLGLVNRLEQDLKVLLRRQQQVAIGDEVPQEILDAEAEVAQLESQRESMTLELGETNVKRDQKERECHELEDIAKQQGADRWETRAELESVALDLAVDRTAKVEELLAIAAGTTPLKLISDLLGRLSDQLADDEGSRTERLVLEALAERDDRLLELIEGDSTEIRKFLEADKAARSERANHEPLHDIKTLTSDTVSDLLVELEGNDAAESARRELQQIDSRITDNERARMALPSDDVLLPILNSLAEVKAQLGILEQTREQLESSLETNANVLERANHRLERIRTSFAEELKDNLEIRRTREFVEQALATLAEVSELTVSRNIKRIEEQIRSKFMDLIGKSSLVGTVNIDSSTLQLSILRPDGSTMSVERLSAGERQLLATAVLWGLSTCAGRELPLVIDTPLGRLDGNHRKKLVENYFPHASGQVIILSTDEEIDYELHEQLRPFVSREFTLTYDEQSESSSIEHGYFAGVFHA